MEEIVGKEELLFIRNNEGKIIPKSIKIEELGKSIKITPLTFSEWQEIRSITLKPGGQISSEEERKFLFNHLVEPKLTEQEVKDMNPKVAEIIIAAILKYSGIITKQVGEITEAEDFLSKTKKKDSEKQ